ncbi:MAG: hypothetical protein K0S46_1908 [Moraxellaceae bacterium]|jgi:hypothetical protein|nr:hypothetical protein [Moraxellaceae bacterium]
MDDFLPKPVELAALQECLARWLPADAQAESAPRPAPDA